METQTVSEDEFDDDDVGKMAPVAPTHLRGSLGRSFSFIKRKSLSNLVKGIDDGLNDDMDDSTKERI